MSKELPEAVLQTYAFWRQGCTLEECLTETLNNEKMEGFDLEYDDTLVDEDENEDPDFTMTTISKLHVWTKSRILIWEPEWRYFRVYPRNPNAKNKFKIKRDDEWT